MRQAGRPPSLRSGATSLHYFLKKSGDRSFAAVGNAVELGAAVRATGFVHFRNHAGFQQSARRGERDFVRAFILETFFQPIFTVQLFWSDCFHVVECAVFCPPLQGGVSDWRGRFGTSRASPHGER